MINESRGTVRAMVPDPAARPVTSVIIPVYNTREYLPACLDSVLAQTQRDIEVILVDDGSTDGSLEVEKAYAAADSRVRVLRQPNLRQGAARNAGLAVARGEYVYFMDSDDVVLPTLLEECHAACEADGLDFCAFDTAGFRDDPAVERPELFGEIVERSQLIPAGVYDGVAFWTRMFPQGGMPFICWLQYFRRSFLLENGLEFTEGIYFEDNDWVLRVYLAARRMGYLPRKLHRYRDRPGSNVHSGFKPELAESCPRIHFLLLDLLGRQEDEDRRRMVYDAGAVLNLRFAQFGELPPTPALLETTSAFAGGLLHAVKDPATPDAALRWHLGALYPLYGSMRAWLHAVADLSEMPAGHDASEGLRRAERELRAFLAEPISYPQLLSAGCTVGLYGSGLVASRFVRVFEALVGPIAADVRILDSTKGDGSWMGYPRLAVDEAVDVPFDLVIVASTRYADEISDIVARKLGESVPVAVVPRYLAKLGI